MFKNESGKWFTKSLFYEMTLPASRNNTIFSLKEDDHIVDGVTYKSLKKLFLSCTDPTEYEFATTHLGGWQHWKAMNESPALSPYFEEWRQERDIMLRSQGIREMINQAESGQSYQAAKWLADKGWDLDKKRGRPSKAEIAKETKEQSKVKLAVMNDYKRLQEG